MACLGALPGERIEYRQRRGRRVGDWTAATVLSHSIDDHGTCTLVVIDDAGKRRRLFGRLDDLRWPSNG